ncbi:ABC transporter permease [Paenibacillus albiflavus]|uniref:ABC transporter permease n=2 Tax=Paenibacillus albiflavus TaxID=2545760 RepID=A0A4R4EEH3_9BACL|nr:oligopeptide ABC transporter permease [Paenibacillus albiflavus]TCZ77867.1 ABC transporter permease [Paenibacillus albiflavus]
MRIAFRRLAKNKLAMGALIFIVLMFLICFLGPLFLQYDINSISVANKNKAPNAAHWVGTDSLGRDVLLRLMLAGRVSLTVGLAVTAISVFIGTVLGAISGFYRGIVDTLIMRLADIISSIPSLPLLIIFGVLLSDFKVEPTHRLFYVMGMLGFISWPGLARLIRSQILTMREQEYMVATEALGLKDSRKIFKHLIPNTIPTVIVSATLGVAGAILAESGLSFLGLGVVPPTPTWGNMIGAATNWIDFSTRPWLWVPPGLCILAIAIAINFLGDGLRDALDPKLKR